MLRQMRNNHMTMTEEEILNQEAILKAIIDN